MKRQDSCLFTVVFSSPELKTLKRQKTENPEGKRREISLFLSLDFPVFCLFSVFSSGDEKTTVKRQESCLFTFFGLFYVEEMKRHRGSFEQLPKCPQFQEVLAPLSGKFWVRASMKILDLWHSKPKIFIGGAGWVPQFLDQDVPQKPKRARVSSS